MEPQNKPVRILPWIIGAALAVVSLIIFNGPNSAQDDYIREDDYHPRVLEKVTENCIIKGNVSFNTGEKIYHLPGCPYYSSTKIDQNYGERWFCSEDEAVTAGWRKAYNCP